MARFFGSDFFWIPAQPNLRTIRWVDRTPRATESRPGGRSYRWESGIGIPSYSAALGFASIVVVSRRMIHRKIFWK